MGDETYAIDVQARYSDNLTAGLLAANQAIQQQIALLGQLATAQSRAGVAGSARVNGQVVAGTASVGAGVGAGAGTASVGRVASSAAAGTGGTVRYSQADEQAISAMMRPMSQGGMAASRDQAVTILQKTGNLGAPMMSVVQPSTAGSGRAPNYGRGSGGGGGGSGGRSGGGGLRNDVNDLQKAEKAVSSMMGALTSMRTLITGGLAATAIAIPLQVANQLDVVNMAYQGILKNMGQGQAMADQLTRSAFTSGFAGMPTAQATLNLARIASTTNGGGQNLPQMQSAAQALAGAYAPDQGPAAFEQIMAESLDPANKRRFTSQQAAELARLGVPIYQIAGAYMNQKFGTKYPTSGPGSMAGGGAYWALESMPLPGGEFTQYLSNYVNSNPDIQARSQAYQRSAPATQQNAQNAWELALGGIGRSVQGATTPLFQAFAQGDVGGTLNALNPFSAFGSGGMGGLAIAGPEALIASRLGLVSKAGRLAGWGARALGLGGAAAPAAQAAAAAAATPALAPAAAPAAATTAGGLGLGTLAAGAGLAGASVYGMWGAVNRAQQNPGDLLAQGSVSAGGFNTVALELARQILDPNSGIRTGFGLLGGGGTSASQTAQGLQQVAQQTDPLVEATKQVTAGFQGLESATRSLANVITGAVSRAGSGASSSGSGWSGGGSSGGGGGGGGSGGFRGPTSDVVGESHGIRINAAAGSGNSYQRMTPLALQLADQLGVPPEFANTAAAMILGVGQQETGLGTAGLGLPNGQGRGRGNIFDIAPTDPSVTFASPQESFANFGYTLNQPQYKAALAALRRGDVEGFISGLRQGGYGTQADVDSGWLTGLHRTTQEAQSYVSAAPAGSGSAGTGTTVQTGDISITTPAINTADPQSLKDFVEAGTDQIMRAIAQRFGPATDGAPAVPTLA